MSCSAAVYILEEPSSRDYARVRRLCEKILKPCSYVIHDYESMYKLMSLRESPHCDAIITLKNLWIFIEFTKLTEPADVNKLDFTVQLLSNMGIAGFEPSKVVRIMHFERMDSVTARIIRSRRTHRRRVIIPMRCNHTLVERLKYYGYIS